MIARISGGPAPAVDARFAEVMGTVVSIQAVRGPLTEGEVECATDAAFTVLEAADETFSLWKPSSVINRIRSGLLDPADAPPEWGRVIDLCLEARELTGGWFDPWSIGHDTGDRESRYDPTGLVKGWAAEQALARLIDAGVAAALVNAGGDVACAGTAPGGTPWRVGIRHPWRPDALACIAEIESAIATSGCYERGPHLIDPNDGSRSARAVSASVTGPSLAIADALATALAVGGREVFEMIEELPGYECYSIDPDGHEDATDGFPFETSPSAGARA